MDQPISPELGIQATRATTDPDKTTATRIAVRNHNPDNINQIQRSVRPVITVIRKTTFSPIALNKKETMPQWHK
jgi:hypothetical protein